MLIVDTDPGGDDALALLWAVSAARAGVVEIAAVTTCGGNVPPMSTYAAAFRVLLASGCCSPGEECPSASWECPPVGAAPADAEMGPADDFMGSDGLGGLGSVLPPPTRAYENAPSSAALMVKELLERPLYSVTIVCLGPLTNLAAAEALHPGVLRRAKEVSRSFSLFSC